MLALITPKLQMRFETQAALRAEFEKNIANRGLFLATHAELEVRQTVEIEIVLAYEPAGSPRVVLRGEVVHRVSPEMVRGAGRAGIAVQLEDSVAALRERFEPLLGAERLPDPDADRDGEHRRSARREPVRVPVRIRVGNRPPFLATSRDLSGTGILLSVREERLAVGEIVRVGLSHPGGGGSVELAGRVVREVRNKRGRVAAVAIAFDRRQAAEPATCALIAALREASHQGRLGGISGSIVELGLVNLLQMLGSSAPQGTLVVEHDGEQGWIAFARNQFLAAELGALAGREALEEMLGWQEGRFEFDARVEPSLLEAGASEPLAAVVLEAVCARDERGQAGAEPGSSSSFGPEATFRIDLEQAELAGGQLDKTEAAVLDLARAGMSRARMEAIIPEPAERVGAAIGSLVEMGVLIPA